MSVDFTTLMYVLPVCLVLGILGISIAGVIVGGIFRRMFRKGPEMPGNVQFWAQGCYGLWTGGEDSGQWDQGRAQSALSSWYGAKDRALFDAVIAGLQGGQTGSVAWDLVRAIDLLRIGAAAGYITHDECWARTRVIAAALRKSYESWEDLADGFEEGMHEWQDSRNVTDPNERGRVERNLGMLRQYIWPRVAWNARL
jgi:hypothetical protein